MVNVNVVKLGRAFGAENLAQLNILKRAVKNPQIGKEVTTKIQLNDEIITNLTKAAGDIGLPENIIKDTIDISKKYYPLAYSKDNKHFMNFGLKLFSKNSGVFKGSGWDKLGSQVADLKMLFNRAGFRVKAEGIAEKALIDGDIAVTTNALKLTDALSLLDDSKKVTNNYGKLKIRLRKINEPGVKGHLNYELPSEPMDVAIREATNGEMTLNKYLQ